MAMSLLAGLLLCLNGLPTATNAQPPHQSFHTNNTLNEVADVGALVSDTDNDAIAAQKPEFLATPSDTGKKVKLKHVTKKPKPTITSTCEVLPATDSGKASKLTSISNSTIFTNCSMGMGLQLPEHDRKDLVENLPMNPRAHLFTFPPDVRDSEGLRPLLCVPQKNGNKQFGGFVFAAWNRKPAISGYAVDNDMRHWEHHSINSEETHVYFVARNPYTRILSMYLQKVVNACISDGQKGCDTHGWHGIKPEISFEGFVEEIELKLTRHGNLCGISHHLCQQVETCITPTLSAQEVTVIRVEEQSCWFPCLVKQIGIQSSLLSNGWEQFSGQACYYSATGDCKDMLRSIDPNKVGVTTGNVHATGASNKLGEHYNRKTAETISRLYADDFRILGYPLWNESSWLTE